jgi:RNA polymerase sigma-70 factor (ECF subfamily)
MERAVDAIGTSCMRDSEIPDETLIQRVVRGETNLYGILACRYERYLHTVIRQIVGNQMDAEDIVQDTHVRALTYLHQFEGRSKFITWLCHVAANEALNQLRKRRPSEELIETRDTENGIHSLIAPTIPDPESGVRAREARETLRKAVAKLPPRYRTIFLLLQVRQVTTEEAAGCLQIRRENVRLRLHRARRLLRKAIHHELH